jgi:uncharacterized Fe-S cluster-containing radical SAM superfamily protein
MSLSYYDPIKLGEAVSKVVTRGQGPNQERKYYRFRGGRWYGGIATADCVGCNLRCKFCWSWRVRDNAVHVGEWKNPDEVSTRLVEIARKNGYRYVRISGGEPTLSLDHTLEVIKQVGIKAPEILFILETNGILIGYSEENAKKLVGLDNLHVRVSIKGCTAQDFSLLTGAYPWGFELQLKALEYLSRHGVSAHPAVMMSFSEERDCLNLKERLRDIDKKYEEEYEEEYVFLYPHVKELLRKHKLFPKVFFEPDNIPEKYI